MEREGIREVPKEPEPKEKERQKRRMYIKQEDVEKYGMTENCKGCIAANRKGKAVAHSEEGRKRME